MKRFVLFILLFIILTLSAAWLTNAAPISVLNSKHNLSSLTTNTIRSVDPSLGGTDEVCVFCHTPHGGNTQAPLWNKTGSSATYSGKTYTSDVLAALAYWPAEDPKTGVPHVKSRICLSCHDGTIALGSLVNLPTGVSTEVPMIGTSGGVMPLTAAGYIDVELRDDHPVAILHDNAKDPELTSAISAGSGVWLYDSAAAKTKAGLGTGYVECTSCHDPHNSEFGNFLVETNSGSALCLRCHSKTGFTSSIHDTAGTAYGPPADGTPTLGATVGGVKCMNCHFPHKASGTGAPPNLTPADLGANTKAGYYLLSRSEENSCYNTGNDRWNTPGSAGVCHGTGASAQTKNIEGLVGLSSSAHRVGNFVGKHEATEAGAAGWLVPGNTNWHVECADCHNPHTAGNTSHTARPPAPVVGAVPTALTSASSLYGTGGVTVSVAPTWLGAPGTYTYLEPKGVLTTGAPGVSYEYQICLKCHSEYAWRNSTAPNSPSFSPAAAMTDQAKEFNPANSSFHPVEAVSVNNQGTLVGAWQTNKGTQTMYCSDCHNNSAAPPQGPHGSAQPFILFGAYNDVLGTAGGAQQPAGDMCMTCHDPATYVTASLTGPAGTGFLTAPGGLNLHASHAFRAVPGNPRPNGSGVTTPISYKCVNCHVRVPHGWGVAGRRAMVIVNGEGTTYGAQYEAGGAGAGLISTFGQPGTPGNYGAALNANCTTATNCHRFP